MDGLWTSPTTLTSCRKQKPEQTGEKGLAGETVGGPVFSVLAKPQPPFIPFTGRELPFAVPAVATPRTEGLHSFIYSLTALAWQ